MSYHIDESLVPHGVGFDDSGQQVPTTMPDFGEQEDERETPLEEAADMLSKLFSFVIPSSGPLRLDLIGQKFVALHFLLNRSGSATLTSFAQRAGVSKQLLDHHAQRMADQMGFHGFGQKRQSTRATYAETQRKIWAELTPEQRRARRKGKQSKTTEQRSFDTERKV